MQYLITKIKRINSWVYYFNKLSVFWKKKKKAAMNVFFVLFWQLRSIKTFLIYENSNDKVEKFSN